MADEFAKGLGILTSAGLMWIVLAGWFNTESFTGTQLFAPNPESVDVYTQLALNMKEVMFYFAILGPLVFWVLLPAVRQGREAWAARSSE